MDELDDVDGELEDARDKRHHDIMKHLVGLVAARRVLADEERDPGSVSEAELAAALEEVDLFHALLARLGDLVPPVD